MFRIDDGFTDLVCSMYDRAQDIKLATNDKLEDAVAAERRIIPALDPVAHKITSVSCRIANNATTTSLMCRKFEARTAPGSLLRCRMRSGTAMSNSDAGTMEKKY